MSWRRILGDVVSRGVGEWGPRFAYYRGPLTKTTTPAGTTTHCRSSIVTRSSPQNEAAANIELETSLTAEAGGETATTTATPARARRSRTKSSSSSASESPDKTKSKRRASDAASLASEALGDARLADVVKLPNLPASHTSAAPAAASTTTSALEATAGAAASDSMSVPPSKPRTRRSKTTSPPDSQPKARRKRTATTAPSDSAQVQQPPTDTPTTTRTPTQPSPAAAPTERRPTAAGVLLIVDGNYLANRSYFGYGSRGLSTSSGVPTTVTYGVMRVLQAALRHIQPTALAVVFDPPGPTFRSAVSLLDPEGGAAAGTLGAAAERLVRQGRLDWQELASRLLGQGPVLADMQAAAAAEAAATPVSYLRPSGSFLPPSPPPPASTMTTEAASTDDGSGVGDGHPSATAAAAAAAACTSRRASRAAEMLELLAAALGPDLATELGLPGLAAAAADSPAAAAALTPPYKAGRLSKSEDFYTDLVNLQRLLGLMSVPPLSRPWLEADDLAGLLVRQAVQQGMAVRILSGDRDLMQLVSDESDVVLLYPSSSKSSSPSPSPSSSSSSSSSSSWPATTAAGGSAAASARPGQRRGGGGAAAAAAPTRDFPFSELREADVVAALGVPPALVADYKALTGDDSDRLPGVSGIGPKIAAQLLSSYGSLEGVHRAADELPPKRRTSLEAALPASQYTLTLARVLGSPGAPALPAGVISEGLLQRLQLRGFDPSLVQRALLELEINSLARDGVLGGSLWFAFGGGAGGRDGGNDGGLAQP